MSGQKMTFTGAHGEELVARAEFPPDGEPRAWALFAHCFTCSKDLKSAVRLSRALAAERIGVFRFDFTGLGESAGDFADTNFSSNVGDLVAAAGYMERELGAPRILVGHSLGGAAVLQAARQIPTSVAVATLGAPADPGHVLRHMEGSLEEIREKGQANVTLSGRTFSVQRQFVEDLESASMEETIGALDRALLIFHSPLDQVVGIDNAARIFQAARHPKSFVSLDEADHLLLDPEDARYAGVVLAAWARRYLEDGLAESGEEGADGEAGRAADDGPGFPRDEEGQVAARIGRDKYRTDMIAGGHALISDEPESVGGTDQGPAPYDLLLSALGACTAMTLRMYADRKEWPLESVTVRLDHSRKHAKDDEACEDPECKLDRIERVVSVTGDLDGEQRERLLEIADKCPVHKTLHAGVRTETRAGE
jgi:putative redox protein